MKGAQITGTGRHKSFEGYSGHGQNSARKSSIYGKPGMENLSGVAELPNTRSGQGEVPATINMQLELAQLPFGLAAAHCTGSAVWADGKRIA